MGNNRGDETSKAMEAYYACIGEAHINNLINDLDNRQDEIDKVEVPASLDKWFYNYVKKRRKDEKRKKMLTDFRRFSQKAAVIVLVILTAMSAVIFSVEAIRVRVLNFFMEKNEKYTEVRIDSNNGKLTPVQDWDSYYSPEYLPEGYFFSEASDGGLIKVLEYTDGVNQIVITQGGSDSGIQLDTEDAVVTEVTIDGNEGLLVIKDDWTMLFWHNDDSSFTIYGRINEEEIIKISENIKKVE
ncbi:MAG: DUF4367 domain-containing protein [Tissierellales bacterium]|nr:DUF4367 domain-containing protein [Tissierellales bacterium]MBN2826367.1 DUF4367 domain-containing protein [Tissierellales bacterium]